MIEASSETVVCGALRSGTVTCPNNALEGTVQRVVLIPLHSLTNRVIHKNHKLSFVCVQEKEKEGECEGLGSGHKLKT